jgi:hypothetical protein
MIFYLHSKMLHLARNFYTKTVKPITAGVMVFTLYSGGYHDGTNSAFYKTEFPITFPLDIAYYAIIGSCLGIMYPISIPSFFAYEYHYHRTNK